MEPLQVTLLNEILSLRVDCVNKEDTSGAVDHESVTLQYLFR